jgi:hypothetical protein
MPDLPLEPSIQSPRVDPDAVCSECGALGAVVFDGATLCLDCHTVKGSCCADMENGDEPTS